jgi:hypothetical protein
MNEANSYVLKSLGFMGDNFGLIIVIFIFTLVELR